MVFGRLGLCALTLSATSFGVANAQSADDWDLGVDPVRKLSIASVRYSTGATLRVQCRDGALAVALGGVAAPAARRQGVSEQFTRRLSDGSTDSSFWESSSTGDGWLSAQPARDARSFRGGGKLSMTATPEGSAPVEIDLELPTTSVNLHAVLEACGQSAPSPFDDARDVGENLTGGVAIEIRGYEPRPGQSIQIWVTCLISAGRLSDCQSERQIPANPRAGAETARHANGERLRLTDVDEAEGKRVTVVITGAGYRR